MADQQSTPGVVRFPATKASPWVVLARRLAMAFAVFAACVLVVFLDRDGYVDNTDPTREVSFIDAIYYTTVSLSTTGYGDITPLATSARLVNALLITPLRIAFLVLLIGTTIEVLATQGRYNIRVARWRKQMKEHVVVIGYGTKGRSAVQVLLDNGTPKDKIVVVDARRAGQEEANADGLTVIAGDATRRGVLRRARVPLATQVIITADSDDATVLSILNVRALAPRTYVVATAREEENISLIRQSGADSVITSSAAVGRLVGLSSVSPTLGSVMEDLLSYGHGLEVAERPLLVQEVGKQPQQLPDQVIAVLRDGNVHRYYDPAVSLLERGDRLIVIRPSEEEPWALRPGTHGERTSDEVEDD